MTDLATPSVTRRRITPDLPAQAACSRCAWAVGPGLATEGKAELHVSRTGHPVRVWRSLSFMFEPTDPDTVLVPHAGTAS